MSCTTKSIASRCLVFVARALTLFLFAMSVGCGGSSYGDDLLAVGDFCFSDSECRDGLCAGGGCAVASVRMIPSAQAARDRSSVASGHRALACVCLLVARSLPGTSARTAVQ